MSAVSTLPSAATKGAFARVRGLTVTERRVAEEAAAITKEKERAVRRARAVQRAVLLPASGGNVPAASRPMGACKLGRGRAAMNAPLQLGGGVKNLEDRKASLMEKAVHRPTHKV